MQLEHDLTEFNKVVEEMKKNRVKSIGNRFITAKKIRS